MKIAVDIGGVVKSMVDDTPIERAKEGIYKCMTAGHQVIFISKCAALYRVKLVEWLMKNGYPHNDVFFCDRPHDKLAIAKREKVDWMIDDKMQVLRDFVGQIRCIWFCTEPHRLDGARHHQPEFVEKVQVASDWSEIIDILLS